VDPVEPPKVEPPKVEPPKADPPKVEPPKVDATDPWKAPPPSPHAPRRTEIRTEGHPLALPFVLTGAVGLIGGMAAGAYGANKLLNPSVGSSCFSDASKCTTDSAKSRRNTGRTFLWVSGISMGTGLVFLITGVALPSKEVIVQTGGLRFRPVVDATPQGGYLGLSGSF
jgi:hypothetical protein